MRLSNSGGLAAFSALILMVSACDLGTTVEVVEVASIEVPFAVEPVRTGDAVRILATPFSGRGEELMRDLTWSSNNTAVASVSSTGRVATQASGAATVTASADGASASVVIYSVPLSCEVEGTLRPGDSVTWSLDRGCIWVQHDRVIHEWFLHVANGANVQIDMTSTFDTYLYLTAWEEGSGFSFITDNDDGGEGRNSRISMFLSPGIYIVAAGSFYSELGSYQLSISSQ